MLATPPPRRPFRLGGVVVEVSGDHVRVGARPVVPLARAIARRCRDAWSCRRSGARSRRGGCRRPATRFPRAADCVAFDADALTAPLAIRRRRRGDRFDAFGAGERRLKSFLIDAKVPRWERDRLPLVESAGRIVWVAGLRRGAAAPVTAATREILELKLIALAEPEARR